MRTLYTFGKQQGKSHSILLELLTLENIFMLKMCTFAHEILTDSPHTPEIFPQYLRVSLDHDPSRAYVIVFVWSFNAFEAHFVICKFFRPSAPVVTVFVSLSGPLL